MTEHDQRTDEIWRLEQSIAVLLAGLRVIAHTDHADQSMARAMQYEAQQTLRVADETLKR